MLKKLKNTISRTTAPLKNAGPGLKSMIKPFGSGQ